MELFHTEETMYSMDTGLKIEELVYHSLMDLIAEDYRLSWVTPIFVEDHPCYQAYEKAQETKEKICDRLGSCDDPDCQSMADNLLLHGKLLATEMFRLGMQYQKMLEESIQPNDKKIPL